MFSGTIFGVTKDLLTSITDDKRLAYYKCDLSDEKEIKAVCKAIKSEVGHPSVLSKSNEVESWYRVRKHADWKKPHSQQCWFDSWPNSR